MCRRCRSRRRSQAASRQATAAAVCAALLLAAVTHHGAGVAVHQVAARAGPVPAAGGGQAVAGAIAYARAQLGKPYVWGGTGPGGFDCSGLVMMAYRTAGVTLPRTSQEQWAAGPRVSHPQPGDLVFFAGSDGTWAAPGHVGLVIGDHMMIEAYATGFPVRISAFGTPAAAPGDGDPAGYTAPWSR